MCEANNTNTFASDGTLLWEKIFLFRVHFSFNFLFLLYSIVCVFEREREKEGGTVTYVLAATKIWGWIKVKFMFFKPVFNRQEWYYTRLKI
jgi:hypothetical protein